VDGVEGKPYDYVGPIHVSPGGAHTLYPARLGEDSFVVLDGREGPKFSNVEIEYGAAPFSPDGLHYAYAATREVSPDLKFLAVADGKEGRLYDYVTGVTYTPDGAHLLYLAYDRAREKSFLVRDGEEVASYEQMPDSSRIHFTPDGKRMYFRLRKEEGGKDGVVVDGRAYLYDEVKDVEFSPDGRRLVFKAQRGGGWVMVVDGVESELYEPDGERGEVAWSGHEGRLAFSEEGGRLAYVGRKGGKEFVVVDGAAGAKYDAVANLGFTPDGRHVVYTARRAGKSLVVVDGVESREYDAFLPARASEREGTLNVEGNTSLSILARRGPELVRVEIEIAEG
jgi:Tol biopolymer transport system component